MGSRFSSLGLALILCLCAVVVGGASLAADERPQPSISVESGDGASRLWVDVVLPDGKAQRRLLRETSAAVSPTASGWGPEGRAGFTTWEESGARWFSYSRDAGETWSEARPLSLGLRLRDGEIGPGDEMPVAPHELSLPSDGRLFVVQLKTISLPEWRAALRGAGADVLAYLPDNAHVVRLGGAQAARVEALAGLDIVERVEPYHPWYRLSAELRNWLEEPGDAVPERMRVRVVAFEWGPAGKGRIAALAGDLGAEIVELPPNGHVVELNVDREQLVRIAAHDDVEWIDPWAPPAVDMDLVREDTGADWLEGNYLSEVDNLGYCGQGVRGEVMDTGIQLDHPDFDGVLVHGPDPIVHTHGTSTYGVVFGNGDRDGDGQGMATGLLPCAEQGYFASYFPPDRYAHTVELKESPYFASFQSNSWGTGLTTLYNSYSEAIDDIIWRLDIAMTQSQSNNGSQLSRPEAWAKNIISVGGIHHYDTLDTTDDAWAGGASVGPAQDGRIKPDVNYWYDHIYTTDVEPDGYVPNSLYIPTFCCTSAATPQVAGVLGLMLQMWKENVWGTDHPPETTVFEAQPHFSTLKALLINNAQQYQFHGEEHDLSRYKQGWGRPSVRVAKERAARSFIVDQEVLLEVGGLAAYRIDVAPGESELKVTMVYPDPPGSPEATMARVNDLDLRVISPSGDVYHGNVGLIAGNASVPGGATNRIDTVENVFVVDPEPGTWSVTVDAVEINEDACPEGHESTCGPTPGGTPEADATFSLVVTGGTGSEFCTAPNADVTATPNAARVGDPVQFESDVSGGAGGPYSYWWDFNGDGLADSTEENPVFVYARPFDAPAKLWVADAASCPATVHEPMTVTGPDLWYDGYIDLTEVEGNGNGGVDPGETWELTVLLRNDGSEPAEGVSAELVPDPASPVSVTLLQASSTYADIAVGAVAASNSAYRFQVDSFGPCGEWISLSLAARSTDPENAHPTEGGVIRLLVGATGPKVSLFFDGFETETGWEIFTWQGDDEWEREAPRGLGEPQADPQGAYEGQFVLGNDVTGLGLNPGNYENEVGSAARSPSIYIPAGILATEVTFAHWLNLGDGDHASVTVGFDVRGDDKEWTWPADHSASFWSVETLDIRDRAHGKSWLRVRIELTADEQGTSSGWNVDALEVRGIPFDSCEPYVPVLRYDRYSDLTEIDGNGNGAVEPGETWEMFVHLRNDGPLPAGGVSADLTVDATTAGSVFMLQGSSEYGTIDPGQMVSSVRAYRFRIGDDFPCGGEVVLSVTDITSSDPAGSYPDEVGVIRIPVGESVIVWQDDFETDTGWTAIAFAGDGEWEIDEPGGLGTVSPDPATGYSGPRVLGNDLSGLGAVGGDYESDAGADMLSPWIDVPPGTVATEVEFARWLNVAAGDNASLWVSGASTGFRQIGLWQDTSEASWTLTPLDIPEVVRGSEQLRFAFRIDSRNSETSSGWNIDAFEVRGLTCGAFDRPLPGEVTHLTVDSGTAGELVLSWDADCGNATTYGIYRGDLRVGYDSIGPEPGACNVPGTSATIPLGSGNAEFFLVVPHKDGEEGSYGTDSAGTPRPPAAGGCYPQGAVDVCAPWAASDGSAHLFNFANTPE